MRGPLPIASAYNSRCPDRSLGATFLLPLWGYYAKEGLVTRLPKSSLCPRPVHHARDEALSSSPHRKPFYTDVWVSQQAWTARHRSSDFRETQSLSMTLTQTPQCMRRRDQFHSFPMNFKPSMIDQKIC